MKLEQWITALISIASFSLFCMASYLTFFRIETDVAVRGGIVSSVELAQRTKNPVIQEILLTSQYERDVYANLMRALDKTTVAISGLIFILSLICLICTGKMKRDQTESGEATAASDREQPKG